jgi:hypothetical protein
MPEKKVIKLKNTGGGELPAIKKPKVSYVQAKDWLDVNSINSGNSQEVVVSLNARGLVTGMYNAIIGN